MRFLRKIFQTRETRAFLGTLWDKRNQYVVPLWLRYIFFLRIRDSLSTVERDSLFVLCEPFQDFSSTSVKLIALNHHSLPLQVLERLLPGNIIDK